MAKARRTKSKRNPAPDGRSIVVTNGANSRDIPRVSRGRSWLIVPVEAGEKYGNDASTHDDVLDPLIEIYDQTYANDPGHDAWGRGKFVALYSASRLAKRGPGGLDLWQLFGNARHYEPHWKLDAAAALQVGDFARALLGLGSY